MKRNAMAGTFQASLKNLGGRAQILEQMYNHKSSVVNAKRQIDNSEPYRLITDSHQCLSVQQHKKLSPNHNGLKTKYNNIKSSQIQQIIDYQKRNLQDNSLDKHINDYNPCNVESSTTLRKNSVSLMLSSKDRLKNNASTLQHIIRSAHVSPIRRGREEVQTEIIHKLNLEAQRKRVQNIGSLNERKKNINDATVYPSLIQRSQRSHTLIDYFDTQILQTHSQEKDKIDKKEKKKKNKSKRKHSKKSKKSKSPNKSVEYNKGESNNSNINNHIQGKSQSQDASNFYISPPQSQQLSNPYNPHKDWHNQKYFKSNLSNINPYNNQNQQQLYSPSQSQSQSFLLQNLNMSRDNEIFDYTYDIPFVRTNNYDELRIRLVNIIIKHQIFSDYDLNDLFAKTQLKNNHLNNTILNQIFDQIVSEILKH